MVVATGCVLSVVPNEHQKKPEGQQDEGAVCIQTPSGPTRESCALIGLPGQAGPGTVITNFTLGPHSVLWDLSSECVRAVHV